MPPLYPNHILQLLITSDKQQHFVNVQTAPTLSTPTYNATLKSLLQVLIVAYLVWAVFYLVYSILCCAIWIWREPFRTWQTRCMDVMTVGFHNNAKCEDDVIADDGMEKAWKGKDCSGSWNHIDGWATVAAERKRGFK